MSGRIDGDGDDEWKQGIVAAFREKSYNARVEMVASEGCAWPWTFLQGFIEGHATLTRNERCTCGDCPIHSSEN